MAGARTVFNPLTRVPSSVGIFVLTVYCRGFSGFNNYTVCSVLSGDDQSDACGRLGKRAESGPTSLDKDTNIIEISSVEGPGRKKVTLKCSS